MRPATRAMLNYTIPLRRILPCVSCVLVYSDNLTPVNITNGCYHTSFTSNTLTTQVIVSVSYYNSNVKNYSVVEQA